MLNLKEGELTMVQGSGPEFYLLTNTGGVFTCSCPAWRYQGAPISRRTCKHLKQLRGEANESARVAGRPGAGLLAATAPTRQLDD
jgi:DNA ligase-1